MTIATTNRLARLAEIEELAATVPGSSLHAQAREIVAQYPNHPAVTGRTVEAVRFDLRAIERGANN